MINKSSKEVLTVATDAFNDKKFDVFADCIYELYERAKQAEQFAKRPTPPKRIESFTAEEERAARYHDRVSMRAHIRSELKRGGYVQRGTTFNYHYGHELPARICEIIKDGDIKIYTVRVKGEKTVQYYSEEGVDKIPYDAKILRVRERRG